MKRIATVVVLALLFFCGNVNAQRAYKTGLGVRIGEQAGVTLKHFVNSKGALEGILAFHHYATELTGLYSVHGNAFGEPRLNWNIGGGAHIGAFDRDHYHYYRDWFGEYYEDRNVYFGLDGILGLEYTLNSAPINFALDWKPEINFYHGSDLYTGDVAFSVRYAFK